MVPTVWDSNWSSGIGLLQDSSLELAMLRSGTAGLDMEERQVAPSLEPLLLSNGAPELAGVSRRVGWSITGASGGNVGVAPVAAWLLTDGESADAVSSSDRSS